MYISLIAVYVLRHRVVDIRGFCDDTNSVQPFLPSVLGEKKKKEKKRKKKSLKVVPYPSMKGQLTSCPRKTGWVCTQEPNLLPSLIFQPQSVLPYGQYTLRGVGSPCHHCIIHTVTVHAVVTV